MLYLAPRQSFSPSCPQGGTWNSCSDGSMFVGCCQQSDNVCSINCSSGNVKPATFDPAYYGKFPDASCGSDSRFYTCKMGPKPFWGCCKNDPCDRNMCAAGNLTAAFLNGTPAQMSAYLSGRVSSSTTLASTSSSTTSIPPPISVAFTSASTTYASTASDTSSSITTTTASSQTYAASPKNIPIPTIAGAAAGSGIAIILLLGILFSYILHAKRSRAQHQDSIHTRLTDSNTPTTNEKGKRSPDDDTPVSPHAPPFDPSYYDHRRLSSYYIELPASSVPLRNVGAEGGSRLSELSGLGVQRVELPSPL